MTNEEAKEFFNQELNTVELDKDVNGNYNVASPAFDEKETAEKLAEAYRVARQYLIDNV